MYNNRDASLVYPAARAVEITPSVDDLEKPTRGIYVGVSGDLSVVMIDGSEVTFVGIAAGVIHPLRVINVGTDTTAESIIGLY